MKKIILFGASLNPVALHHLAIIKSLLNLKIDDRFCDVVALICGFRDDGKDSVNDMDPVHRACMFGLAVKELPKKRFRAVFDDLENNEFLRSVDLEKRYEGEGEIWHAFGYDLIKGAAKGEAEIQTWKEWKKLYFKSRFVIIKRAGYDFDPADLSPRSIVVEPEVSGSSTQIRTRIFNRRPFEHLVPPAVAEYINRFSLYRGSGSGRIGKLFIEEWNPKVIYDRTNFKSMALAGCFKEISRKPWQIIGIGGDGFMLEAIRRYWPLRLPIIGFNTGSKGHLLSNFTAIPKLPAEFIVYNLPMLRVRAVLKNGKTVEAYASNEVRTRSKTDYRRRKLEAANQEIERTTRHKVAPVPGLNRKVLLSEDLVD